LLPLTRMTTISLYVPPVVDIKLPDHIWIAARPYWSVTLVLYIQRLEAELPLGSWLTAITAALDKIARSFGGTIRISFPMMRGLFAAAPRCF